MHLAFLYGPAAAGKLTTGKELAKLTGYPLFHNHLIVNAVVAVFPFGSPEFIALRHEFWMRTFETAAKQSRSLIFTFAPEETVPATFVPEFRAVWEGNGGAVHFIKLSVSEEEQERRIELPDRMAVGKLCSRETLRAIRARKSSYRFAAPVDLEIDTESSGPEESAQLIISALALPPQEPYTPFPG